jgi:peptide-methionine (S)-S-oxide reductase
LCQILLDSTDFQESIDTRFFRKKYFNTCFDTHGKPKTDFKRYFYKCSAMHYLSLLALTLSCYLSACGQSSSPTDSTNTQAVASEQSDTLQTAYFASGCFWCVEAIYESVNGVKEVESGYSGGHVKHPSYEAVCSGATGHAETVKVYYDPRKISYEQLLLVFFKSHDPTTKNRQGPDSGSQYRSAIFYQTAAEEASAKLMIQQLLKQEVYPSISTEVVPFTAFYKAEAYHQNYECRNPYSSYIQQVSLPRLEKFKQQLPELLKK